MRSKVPRTTAIIIIVVFKLLLLDGNWSGGVYLYDIKGIMYLIYIILSLLCILGYEGYVASVPSQASLSKIESVPSATYQCPTTEYCVAFVAAQLSKS